MNFIPKILYFFYHRIKEFKKINIVANQKVIYAGPKGPIEATVLHSGEGMATITWIERIEGTGNYSIRKTDTVLLKELTIREKKNV